MSNYPILTSCANFDLIHVGKCGGSSVVHELKRKEFDFEHFHLRKPIAAPDRRYIVLVRDPLTRFVSAFNWRCHLLCVGDQRQEDAGIMIYSRPLTERESLERSFLSQFKDANELAERLMPIESQDSLPLSSMLKLIGHVQAGFSWHLDHLLDVIDPQQLLGVICAENFKDDFEALFGFRPTLAINRDYTHRPTELSELACKNLKHGFEAEYRTLARLKSLAQRAGVKISMSYS